jgi:hypothetical protein
MRKMLKYCERWWSTKENENEFVLCLQSWIDGYNKLGLDVGLTTPHAKQKTILWSVTEARKKTVKIILSLKGFKDDDITELD